MASRNQQANKWLVYALLVLATATSCARANTLEEDEAEAEQVLGKNYQDDMTRAIAIVWAGEGDEPAGFERTQQAFVTVLNQLTAPEMRGVELPAPLAGVKRLASLYLDACELSRPKCEFAFETLAKLRRDELAADSPNQGPYLSVCERAQRRFCDGLGSTENAKKAVWYDLKREVRKEDAAAHKAWVAKRKAEEQQKGSLGVKVHS